MPADQFRAQRLYPLWDALFFIAIAIFSWLAVCGSIELSANGAVMDSDLETYAQGMAGEALRQLFAEDPVLSAPTPANSIPNLQRWLANWLAPHQQWATGLLRAGGIAIFLFFSGWYILGRKLFAEPVTAALLALCCSITIWIGWGTFWGILHSNPVPRVFFAAVLPFLFLGFFYALPRPMFRPAIMLAVGLCIWIHGVSALNCGAMFFTAFTFLKPQKFRLYQHLLNIFTCLIAFMLPVLVFLWPSLTQPHPFTEEELGIFQNLFNLRWHEDYSGFGKRLLQFISPASPALPVLAGGAAGWLILYRKKNRKFKDLYQAAPLFMAALALVTFACWLEGIWAPAAGRLQMGHELVRGLRLLIPVSWLLIIAAVSLLTSSITRRLILTAVFILLLIFAQDHQYIAVQYSISKSTGIQLPLTKKGESIAENSNTMREIFTALHEVIPAGEKIYCPQDVMPVRYLSKRILVHSFKDGYVFFYNKDQLRSRQWLTMENLAHSSQDGWMKAWLESGAQWLLLPPGYNAAFLPNARIITTINGWKIIHKT